MDPNNTIRLKILDYFNGRLSAQEEALLINWMKEGDENKAYFFQIKNSLDPEKIDHPLLRSSYSELQSKLLINRQFRSLPKGRFRKLSINFSRVAALMIIAAIFGFAVALFVNQWTATNSNIVWFETQVPRGEKSQILLPDGSKVWLNSESSLSYPSNFMKENRDIKLKGEAYFEVAKLNGKDFTVETKDFNIRVLGTKFNVTAYEDFKRTETTLLEGTIEIQRGKKTINVSPGQTFIFKENQFFTKETNAVKSAKWKDDIFDFDRITFQEMVVRLERWYDVDIEIKGEELKDIVYSGVFKNEETIDQVLNTFQLTMPIQYSRDDFRKISITLIKK